MSQGNRHRLHPDAAKDLVDIVDYFDEQSDIASDNFLDDFWIAVELLERVPGAGQLRNKRGRLRALRSWSLKRFSSYLVFYLPLGTDGIHVLRVVHGSRNLKRMKFPKL